MDSRPITRAKNKTQHPGSNHTRYDNKRRTAAQITTDRLADADARLGAIHASAEKQRMQVQEVAQYEAGLRKRVEQQRSSATRPDLATTISSSQVKPTITIPPSRRLVSQQVIHVRHNCDID